MDRVQKERRKRRKVVNWGEDAEKLLAAFGRENRDSRFAWEEGYGGGLTCYISPKEIHRHVWVVCTSPNGKLPICLISGVSGEIRCFISGPSGQAI